MAPTIVAPAPPPLVDDPRVATIEGCEPGGRIEVEARFELNGTAFASSAVFEADADGVVDLATSPSIGGSYEGIDAFGLLGSGTPAGSSDVASPPAPARLHLAAGRATATLERHWLAPGATLVEVDDSGVLGQYARPAGDGPFPAVVCFGGSGGGLGPAASWAPLLASRGIATLAIAYFGAPSLPPALVGIEVEVVERAVQWLRARDEIVDGPLGIIGQSRGAELALLAAIEVGGFDVVVLFSGTSLLWGGLGAGGPIEEAAWTWRGEPVEYVRDIARFEPPGYNSDSATALTGAYLAAMAEAGDHERIPFERVPAPILAVSGTDDAMWPSAQMVDEGAQRARAAGHEGLITHLRYGAAGHTAPGPPGVPVFCEVQHPVTGMKLAFGGTRAGCAAARADSWPQVVAFLHDALQP